MFEAIGLSNFDAKQIQRIYDAATVKPSNLQVTGFRFPQRNSHGLCLKRGMKCFVSAR